MPSFYDQLKEAAFENRTADPSNTPTGRVWFRTDSSPTALKYYDGSATCTIAELAKTQSLTNKTITSAGSNPASTGVLRMANAELVAWRNAANTANRTLSCDSGNALTYTGGTAGNEVVISASHSDDTNSASHARVRALSGGASGGDAYFDAVITGATSWGIGADNSDSDAFIIANGALGTNNALKFSTGSAPEGQLYGNMLMRAQKELRLGDSDSSNYTALKGAATIGTNYTVTMPASSPADNTFLKHTTSGTYSWAASANTIVTTTKAFADSPVTISNGDDVYAFDTSGGAISATLPDCATNPGKVFYLKKTTSDFNAVTISRAGSDTIVDSGSSVTSTTLNTIGEEIVLVSLGSTVWQVLSRRIPSIWVAYTPTCNLTTNATPTGFWRRVGDGIECQVRVTFSAGNSQATTCTFTIPNSSSWTIDTAKLTGSSTAKILGSSGTCHDQGGSDYDCFAVYNSTTTVLLRLRDVSATYPTYTSVNTNGNIPFATGADDFFDVTFWAPITGLNG